MAKKTTAAPRGAAPKSPFRKQAGGLGSINPIPTPAELLSKTAPEPPMTGVNPLSKGLASGHYFAGHGPGVDEPIGKGFAPQSLAANPVHPVGGFMARNFPETAAKPLPAFLAHHADKQLNWARYLPEALGGAAATPIGLVTGNKNLFQSGSRSLWSPVEAATGIRTNNAPTFSDASEMMARQAEQGNGNAYQRNVQPLLWRAAPTLAQASIPGAAVLPEGMGALAAARQAATTLPSALGAAKGVGRLGAQTAAMDEMYAAADPERGLGGGMISGPARAQFDAGPLAPSKLKAEAAAREAKMLGTVRDATRGFLDENLDPSLRKTPVQPAATTATTIPPYDPSLGKDHFQVLTTLRGAAEGKIPVEQAQKQLTDHLAGISNDLTDAQKAIVAPLAQGKNLTPQGFQQALDLFSQSPAAKEVTGQLAEQGSKSPWQDAIKWFTDAAPWAKGAMIAGLPLALLGLGMSVFGEGGIGSMIMAALGAGLMAAGQSGEGGLLHGTQVGNFLQPLGEMAGNFLGNMGQQAGGAIQNTARSARSWLEQGTKNQPATTPAPVQAMPAAAALPEGFDPNHNGKIDPEEFKQLLQDPNILTRIQGLQPAQRQSMLSASLPPAEISSAKGLLGAADSANKWLPSSMQVPITQQIIDKIQKEKGVTISPEVANELANTLRSM